MVYITQCTRVCKPQYAYLACGLEQLGKKYWNIPCKLWAYLSRGYEDLKVIVTYMDIGFPHVPLVMNLLQTQS
jgi:hypothetical protein